MRKGQTNGVKILLGIGADINKVNNEVYTPFELGKFCQINSIQYMLIYTKF